MSLNLDRLKNSYDDAIAILNQKRRELGSLPEAVRTAILLKMARDLGIAERECE